VSASRRQTSGSYARIYAVVRRIPRGRVATYGQVASVAGLPGQPRLAGYALHASEPHDGLPWHRVLGAGGRLTLARLDPDSALTQRLRLEAEGVRFTSRGRVDLSLCQWRPEARRRKAAAAPRGARQRAASGRRVRRTRGVP
jgi:methylated-DNA-protein-cysteine methyltransferase-like protein